VNPLDMVEVAGVAAHLKQEKMAKAQHRQAKEEMVVMDQHHQLLEVQ
jgi:hypothetical protein